MAHITPLRIGSLLWLSAAIAILALSGCKTGTVTKTPGITVARVLTREGGLYIVTPRDGSYNGKQYAGSGAEVASAFNAAFLKNGSDVIVGGASESTASAIESAKTKGCAFVVIPTITRWEDRATEWSGLRDKMELFVKIVNVSDGTVVSSAEINGKSRWATLGGDHPEDLLKRPVQEWVAGLY